MFRGRSTRREFWTFVLTFVIIAVILSALKRVAAPFGVILLIYLIVLFTPCLDVGVRRMHDDNKSGWFIILPLYDLYLLCLQGTPGDNRFGKDPREVLQSEQVLSS